MRAVEKHYGPAGMDGLDQLAVPSESEGRHSCHPGLLRRHRYCRAARSFGSAAGRMELLVARDGPRSDPESLDCTSTRPSGSGPMQKVGARDSELTCVQSDQRMHGPGIRTTAAEIDATVAPDDWPESACSSMF